MGLPTYRLLPTSPTSIGGAFPSSHISMYLGDYALDWAHPRPATEECTANNRHDTSYSGERIRGNDLKRQSRITTRVGKLMSSRRWRTSHSPAWSWRTWNSSSIGPILGYETSRNINFLMQSYTKTQIVSSLLASEPPALTDMVHTTQWMLCAIPRPAAKPPSLRGMDVEPCSLNSSSDSRINVPVGWVNVLPSVYVWEHVSLDSPLINPCIACSQSFPGGPRKLVLLPSISRYSYLMAPFAGAIWNKIISCARA